MRTIVPAAFALSVAMLAGACLEGSVEFGPPNNLRLRGNASIEPCVLPEGADGSVCPDWETEVFPLLDEKYNCALSGCHLGPNDPTGVNMVKGDHVATHAALTAFTNNDRPYISETEPENAYLLCNIDPAAPVLIGSFMPRGEVISPEDLIIIGNWVACGMKLSGGTPVDTGGGGAGAGAAGGGGSNAGGAGGS